MQNSTRSVGRDGEAAVREGDPWRRRAEQQAQRADRLEAMLEQILEVAGDSQTRAFEAENDDRLMCEGCGKRGWPEDGFGPGACPGVDFCANCYAPAEVTA